MPRTALLWAALLLSAPLACEGRTVDLKVDGQALDSQPHDGSALDATASDGPRADADVKKCQELDTKYIAAVKAAKNCDFRMGAKCDLLVKNKLSCPCQTHVDPSHTKEVKLMQALEAQWIALKCNQGLACPPVPCPSPGQGTCIYLQGCQDTP